MKYKNTILLVLLLFILTLTAYFQFQTRQKRFQPLESEPLLFPNLNTDRTDRIEIITLTKRTVLEKQDNNWFVTTSANFPAEERLVHTFLRRMRTLTAGEVVSDKPEKHHIFKVDGTGTKVKLFQNRENLQVSFHVGKTDDDYVDTYLRKEESDRVLAVHDNIQQIFTPHEWRSHYLFRFKPEDVREVTFSSPQEGLHIKQRTDGSWEMKSPETAPLDERLTKKFLNNLCSLRSVDFAKRETGRELFEKPKFKIKILLKDKSVRTLVVGKEVNPITFYVRILEKTQIFLVPTRLLNQLQQYTHRIFQPGTSRKTIVDEVAR